MCLVAKQNNRRNENKQRSSEQRTKYIRVYVVTYSIRSPGQTNSVIVFL